MYYGLIQTAATEFCPAELRCSAHQQIRTPVAVLL